MNKSQIPKSNLICNLALVIWCLTSVVFAQESNELEFTLDVNSPTISLPKIFRPNIDLSGRGQHYAASWPQGMAAPEVLDTWGKDIGFTGMYRLQYNLWEINASAKDKSQQDSLLANYESIIKRINDAGGVVILDIFGTPAGLGKALDKKSPPLDLRAFKELIKGYIRELSCNKKYNIWYEVWSAPDLDDFFLGRKQEYLAIYRAVAESIVELEAETKINIPVGGPGVSWWFQNCDSNSIITPEKSLIYDLIRYCYRSRLPLDFISWHAYSTDPKVEFEVTRYNKTSVALVRDWLSYFHFQRDTPLIIDEWNYDSGANLLPARGEFANVAASFIPARLKNMYEAGLDLQLYFCLEDFQSNKENVVRNTGVFWFDSEASEYKGSPKSTYNVFRMMSGLGKNMFVQPKTNDDFCGMIATKEDGYVALLLYNYIDPYIGRNYLSRKIASLNDSERRTLLGLARTEKIEKIFSREIDVSTLRPATGKLKTMLKKAQELNDKAKAAKSAGRAIKLAIKNLKEDYVYQRFVVDPDCSFNCKFAALEEKEIKGSALYQEALTLPAYSAQMIILKKKPAENPPEEQVADDKRE
ncbi:MAG: hypothetical protein WC532_03610 [Candidatus Omnitrophota bacterium]